MKVSTRNDLYKLKVAIDKLLAESAEHDYLETGSCIEILEWASKTLEFNIKPETPNCQCGVSDAWVIRREFVERQTWNPETNTFHDKEMVCVELDIYCSECGHYTGNQKFIDFLGEQ